MRLYSGAGDPHYTLWEAPRFTISTPASRRMACSGRRFSRQATFSFTRAPAPPSSRVNELHIKDFLDFENSITGYLGQPVPSVVSFRVQWTAIGAVNNFNNATQKFRGTFRNATAQLEYRIRTVDFDIESAPLAASTTLAAELGQESNGSFY